MDQLDRINSQYEKMRVEKLIPCNCSICNKAEEPHFYDYSDLKNRIQKGKQTVECRSSYDDVNVYSLLNAIMDESVFKPIDRYDMQLDLPTPEPTIRNKVFVSYSHKDKGTLAKVQLHMKVLKHEGLEIEFWDDTQIEAGDLWLDEIKQALTTAKVAVLLVSTEFLASEFICNNELPCLLKAAQDDGATILPLILKPCRFAKNPHLSKYQSVNSPDQALSKLLDHEQDEMILALVDRIESLMCSH
jgi:hypothetical protein